MVSIIERDIDFYEGQVELEQDSLRRCPPKDERLFAVRRDACRDVVAALKKYAAVFSASDSDLDKIAAPDVHERTLLALEELLRQTAYPDTLHPAFRAARKEAAAVFAEARGIRPEAQHDFSGALASVAQAEESARRQGAAPNPDPEPPAPGRRL